jgi:hypothetical protein
LTVFKINEKAFNCISNERCLRHVPTVAYVAECICLAFAQIECEWYTLTLWFHIRFLFAHVRTRIDMYLRP